MHGLNHILSNRSQLIVLRALNDSDRPLTGRGVERLCGLSNRATMQALESLVEARAVFKEPSGRASLYSLNGGNYLVQKCLQPAFEAEELFWSDLGKTVQSLVKPRPLAVVATGPLAREETVYGGRLMLTMVFSSSRKRIKSLNAIGDLADMIRERYGMVLEHTLLDTGNMDLEEHEPLWRRVEREGILLFGRLP